MSSLFLLKKHTEVDHNYIVVRDGKKLNGRIFTARATLHGCADVINEIVCYGWLIHIES